MQDHEMLAFDYPFIEKKTQCELCYRLQQQDNKMINEGKVSFRVMHA